MGPTQFAFLVADATDTHRYHGADLGILVSRGRFLTDDRQLTDRAKAWVKAINGEFESIAVTGSSAPAPPPMHAANKMF